MELAGLILVIKKEGPININTEANKVPKLIKIKSNRDSIYIISLRIKFEKSELRLKNTECQTNGIAPEHAFANQKDCKPKKGSANREIIGSQCF